MYGRFDTLKSYSACQIIVSKSVCLIIDINEWDGSTDDAG